MDFGLVVLLTASLSFMGLGARPPSPEWGAMISEGATDFYYWWVAFGPGLAILSVVMGTNFLGDALRDALDPRSRALTSNCSTCAATASSFFVRVAPSAS